MLGLPVQFVERQLSSIDRERMNAQQKFEKIHAVNLYWSQHLQDAPGTSPPHNNRSWANGRDIIATTSTEENAREGSHASKWRTTSERLLAEHRHDRATRFRWIVHLGVRIELRAASSAESIITRIEGGRESKQSPASSAVRERWAKDGRERVAVLGGLLKTAKDKDKDGAKGRKESKDAEKKRNREKKQVKKKKRETETESRRSGGPQEVRPWPVSDQPLGSGSPKGIIVDGNGNGIMTILDAATADPAPDASPRSYHAGSVPRQSQGDEDDTQNIFPHRLDTSLKKIETVGAG
ncbi:hypothetical protein BD410DRAFT_803285 [Rickenella mellea]|uniref:Uncharacterized protein n=1 Tax=Rickenella mellea TaxID=50990 RepID=A0A4Y7Q496_9AGAM|nr:hypothetical protein BD410DRAFT_803285 [Rickenella mellea]